MKSGGPLKRRAPGPCSVEGCEIPWRRAGMCGKHYARKLRHGDVNTVNRPGLREEVRFSRATRRGEPSDYRPDLGPCLIYLGADNGNGYGQFAYNGKNGYAHRYAWERVNGPIPDGLTVDHLCRVRRCVEVSHMELVDAVTNYLRGVASWSGKVCRSGKHARTPENISLASGRLYCGACRREQARARNARKPKKPDPRVLYDQALVRVEIAKVRTGQQRIVDAARTIGCNPNYLGRRIWRETRKDVLARDDNTCQLCGATAVQLDVHHRRNRASGGTADPIISFGFANLMSLCRACHQHITVSPAVSYERGWSVRSSDDPASVPVFLAEHGWVYLTATGGRIPLERKAA